MKTLRYALVAIVLFAFAAPSVFAQEQQVGTTSYADVDITLTIPALVQINGAADINEGANYDGQGDFDVNDPVCIYSNMAAGANADYIVEVDGSDSPGTGQAAGFYVGSAATNDAIPFDVYWADASDGTGEQEVFHDTPSQPAAPNDWDAWSPDVDCAVNNARFRVFMARTDILDPAVNAGTYTNTIRITITPSEG